MRAWFVVPVLAHAACTSVPDKPADSAAAATCAELASSVGATFEASCAPCHLDGSQFPELSAGEIPRSLVGVPSQQVDEVLVAPGDLGASWMWTKLTLDPDLGTPMPPAGPLDDAALEAIRQWILLGPATCAADCDDPSDPDGDHLPTCWDACPDDPLKAEPGICDCGAVDGDGDEDGTVDCLDACPDDPLKTESGSCGCGVPDLRADTGGPVACEDVCPSDPAKLRPGICGCGTADTDTDGDGAADCLDACPFDPDKTEPGVCDCGVPDTDLDGDGGVDCADLCPGDPAKTAPGACGCGTPDVDSDGDSTLDCLEACPDDPAKTDPGACGCGTPDLDTDGDGTADCLDACPDHPAKVLAGSCGCALSEADLDGDTTPDCGDACLTLDTLTARCSGCHAPGDTSPDLSAEGILEVWTTTGSGGPMVTAFDLDDSFLHRKLTGDLVGGEGGPMPPAGMQPDLQTLVGDWILAGALTCGCGTCGCGTPDVDGDGDGTPDCIDGCVDDPDKIDPGDCGCGLVDADLNGDGVADCLGLDLCPDDPAKSDPGQCGCGWSDADLDASGAPDCGDPCVAIDVLDQRCGACHAVGGRFPAIRGAELPMDLLLLPGMLVPGDPEASFLHRKITGDLGVGEGGIMPPGTGLVGDQLDVVTRWLVDGPAACGCDAEDSDGDGLDDCTEDCPADPAKWLPGLCGCGIDDVDGDGDTTPDCFDACPIDPAKIEEGACGCGTADTDSDGDATADCLDACPADPAKSIEGDCGCGVADSDNDGDGTPDCVDACPSDPDKITAGSCGCGAADVDLNGDGVTDCLDDCPDDPDKVAPGACGCGTSDDDSDADGALDCLEDCPFDPAKLEPGTCGCGAADTDRDDDGVFDCFEGCPDDPAKVNPLTCGCGISEVDVDLDGVPDCGDGCVVEPALEARCASCHSPGWESPSFQGLDLRETALVPGMAIPGNPDDSLLYRKLTGELTVPEGEQMPPGGQVDLPALSLVHDWLTLGAWPCGCTPADEGVDGDGDGAEDCRDSCVADPAKTEPGSCGCGVVDTDSDLDGVADCTDACPLDPDKLLPGACGCGTTDLDSDFDGVADCLDGCPLDTRKLDPGACGCGLVDDTTDVDGDGLLDCLDACPDDPDKTAPGACGCGLNEAGCTDDCPSDPGKSAPGICGCGTPDTDTDLDGVRDCNESCDDDPDKTEAGICGCGVADVDGDGDGWMGCEDNCPDLPNVDQDDSDLGYPALTFDGHPRHAAIIGQFPATGCDDLSTLPVGVLDPAVEGLAIDGEVWQRVTLTEDRIRLWQELSGSDLMSMGFVQTTLHVPTERSVSLRYGSDDAPRVWLDDALVHSDPLCSSFRVGRYTVPLVLTAGVHQLTFAVANESGGWALDWRLEDLSAEPLPIFHSAFPGDPAVSDGVGDVCDLCPDDAWASAPGVCGCEVVDGDADGDGTLDCLDACPTDLLKTSPGTCGCAVVDSNADSDGDGTLDCLDACPADPGKIDVGECGCGSTEVGSEPDGSPICDDFCIDDPDKALPGACGCGLPDVDGDSDGALDCDETCPADPAKLEPGPCGCGEVEVDDDGDGTADCIDVCPGIADPDQLDTDGYPVLLPGGVPWVVEVIGPFPGLEGCGDVQVLPDGVLARATPETLIDGLAWEVWPYEALVDLRAIEGEDDLSMAFLQITVDVPSPRDVTLHYDAEEASKVWLGDTEIHAEFSCSRVQTDRYGLPLSLDAGEHVITIGVAHAAGRWHAELRLEDLSGLDPIRLLTRAPGDGVGDACDACPTDGHKTEPGTCGCEVFEEDDDGDGLGLCLDHCPDDPDKTEPGICGCGTSDQDLDGDGLAECGDACLTRSALNTECSLCHAPDGFDPDLTVAAFPESPLVEWVTPHDPWESLLYKKLVGDLDVGDGAPMPPGRLLPDSTVQLVEDWIAQGAHACGCEAGSDTLDSDGDGRADCGDLCPADPDKVDEGACGCGSADLDGDGDGVADCLDACPLDPAKADPGACGCDLEDVDTDLDGAADCVDVCPGDPTKTDTNTCGCGLPDLDTDGDTVLDCVDACPWDGAKTAPGICGCGLADADPACPDACPDDPDKIGPGICGCGTPDADTDGDGHLDCLEACAADPSKIEAGVCGCGTADVDTDGDSTADCLDACPANGAKDVLGSCGCDTADDDLDEDGVADCLELCSGVAHPTNLAYFRDVAWQAVIAPRCMGCHLTGGNAPQLGADLELVHPSELVASSVTVDAFFSDNMARIAAFAFDEPGSGVPRFVAKARGLIPHGGGRIVEPGTAADAVVIELGERLSGGEPLPTCTPDPAVPSFEEASLLSPAATFRKATLMLADRLPTPEEQASITDLASVDPLLDALMTEEAFGAWVEEAWNDTLLVRGLMSLENGNPGQVIDLKDHAATSFAFLHRVGQSPHCEDLVDGEPTWEVFGYADLAQCYDRSYAQNLGGRMRYGYAEEPLALVRSVVMEGRPFSEVLTDTDVMSNWYSSVMWTGSAGSAGNGFVAAMEPDFPMDTLPADSGDVLVPSTTEMRPLSAIARTTQIAGRMLDPETNAMEHIEPAEYPRSGLLSSRAMLQRYPTTDTNLNRHRAQVYLELFLGIDVESLSARATDPVQSALLFRNPIVEDPTCNVCHNQLDPMAGLFQHFDDDEYLASINWPPQEMKEAGLPPLGPGPERGTDWDPEAHGDPLQWLAANIIADDRFPVTIVRHAFQHITTHHPLELPSSIGEDTAAELEAFQRQKTFLVGLAVPFHTHGDLKQVYKGILLSPWFRATGTEPAASGSSESLDHYGHGALITPEHLLGKVEALLGRPWPHRERTGGYSNDFMVRTDDRESGGEPIHDELLSFDYRDYLGGIDAMTQTERQRSFDSVRTATATRLAYELGCVAIQEFAVPATDRALFALVEPAHTPDADETLIRSQIATLLTRTFGSAPTPAEAQDAWEVYRAVWDDGQVGLAGGVYPTSLPDHCQLAESAPGLEDDFTPLFDDSTYSLRSWMALVSYLALDHRFLMDF